LSWSKQADRFNVSFAYDDPTDSLDRRDEVDEPLHLDTSEILELTPHNDEYGRKVGDLLFGGPTARSFYDRAVATARDRDVRLHLRLLIDPRAPLKYHSIRWESMRDPTDGSRISTQRNVLLSRYVTSSDWRKIRPTPWHRLKALVVVANPADLATKDRVGMPESPLYSIDVEGELTRARAALAQMDIVELAEPGKATLQGIVAAVRDDVDVLYLVCHGGTYDDQPRLYLEDSSGKTDVVDGSELAIRIGELERQPSLAVLCSCQSAGAGDEAMASDGGALSALGPALAASGVAAVIGMQGNITMETAQRFVPAFFRELNVHGMVDLAVADARSTVADRPDWWMPVLYSRLRRGRAWYKPEFADGGDRVFRVLIDAIDDGESTPILGSGVAGESILPSREELAKRWASRWLMPIAPENRVDLAKVAQYLAATTAPHQPQREVTRYLANQLRTQYAADLPEEFRESTDVGALVHAVGELARIREGDQYPYKILAELKQPIYVTTSWSSLLEDAIRAEGREPIVRSFEWHKPVAAPEPIPEPTREAPLVYHLFGTFADKSSLVVTEDNYFAWLRSWIKRVDKNEGIPGCVGTAMTDQTLLFLGFGLDDWEFRVLFHAIKSFSGSDLIKDKVHVGVQVSPEGHTIEPEAIQAYLGAYFSRESVNIYWGSCQQFLDDLASKRAAPHG
jgi:hypothetical protein